jgi:predicted Rossmann fold nucleotide-binding protein DprA/Smf involved in DNA uptake
MKLGIVGSRQRAKVEDLQILRKRVRQLQPNMIISGGCSTGADAFAEQIAREMGIPILIHYPKLDNLRTYTRQQVVEAMYARNKLIAIESDYLIAFVASDRKGGTESTIKYFVEYYSSTWKENLEIL